MKASALRSCFVDLLDEGYPIRSQARGESMMPRIRRGDFLVVVPATLKTARIGDIIVYRRRLRRDLLTAHRVIRKGVQNGQPYLVTKGDANTARDLPILYPELVMGRVARIERVGRTLALDTPLRRLEARLIARLSLGGWIWRFFKGSFVSLLRRI